MRILSSSLIVSACAALALCAMSGPAFAYLDAGTGSMILQLLVGGAAGVLVVARLYWSRLKAFLRIGRTSEAATSEAQPVSSKDASRHG